MYYGPSRGKIAALTRQRRKTREIIPRAGFEILSNSKCSNRRSDMLCALSLTNQSATQRHKTQPRDSIRRSARLMEVQETYVPVSGPCSKFGRHYCHDLWSCKQRRYSLCQKLSHFFVVMFSLYEEVSMVSVEERGEASNAHELGYGRLLCTPVCCIHAIHLAFI